MSMSDKSVGLEMDLLASWEGWDQQDTMSFGFYDAVLDKSIGKFSAGEKVKYIEFNYGKSSLLILDQEEQEHKFALSLSVE